MQGRSWLASLTDNDLAWVLSTQVAIPAQAESGITVLASADEDEDEDEEEDDDEEDDDDFEEDRKSVV